MAADIKRVDPFDYRGFGEDQIHDAITHVRGLGEAFDSMRAAVAEIGDEERRGACQRELDSVSQLADDFVEVGFEHLEDEAGFLRHVGVLGELTAEQQQRLDEFRAEYERRVGELREKATQLQDAYAKVYKAYYER